MKHNLKIMKTWLWLQFESASSSKNYLVEKNVLSQKACKIYAQYRKVSPGPLTPSVRGAGEWSYDAKALKAEPGLEPTQLGLQGKLLLQTVPVRLKTIMFNFALNYICQYTYIVKGSCFEFISYVCRVNCLPRI